MSSGVVKVTWWQWIRSLQSRLLVWNTLVILALAVAMLVALRMGLWYTLIREEDQLLREDIAEVRLFLIRSKPIDWVQVQQAINEKATGHAPRNWFCEILKVNGDVVITTDQSPALEWSHFTDDQAAILTIDRFRVCQQPIGIDQIGTVIIRVGATLDDVRDDVARVTQLATIIGLGLLLLAPFGGYLLAKRAILPLKQINQTTAGLRPSHLEERLVSRQTGDELDQLTDTINGFLDRIANYLEKNRELVANAAHELRSPLTAIRSSAEVALHQDRSVDDYKEFLARVVEESSRLGMLVNQLLLLAESDANRLELKNQIVTLDQLVKRCVDMFDGVAELRGIRLVIETTPATTMGDEHQLRQVFLNLLDNAMKFTQQGGTISARVWLEDHHIHITIQDSGMGISKADLPKVFDRFFRANRERERRSQGGTGLGLSICQAIVTAHRGTIELTSEPGHGTTAHIMLPHVNTLSPHSH